MSTVLNVIETAFRRSGLKARGANINATDKEVGMERLAAFYKDMAEGLFGRQDDVYLTDGTAYTTNEFERVINPFTATVTLPTTVTDAFSGEGRPPIDGAIVTIVVPGEEPTINVYDANRAEWQDLGTLTLDGYAPLTNRWEDGIKNMLAVMLADDVGEPISPFLAKRAGSARLSIASRYGSARRQSQIEFY